jgi:uncharacterized OB-fold protein
MREHNGTSFYEYLGESRLMGSRCSDCDALFVPPRPLCSSCYGEQMTWEEMSGAGELIGFTTVHIAPTAMIEAGYDRNNPYCTGVVRLAEGPAISAQIVGVDPSQPETIDVGAAVRATFIERSHGDGVGVFLGFEATE